MKKSLLAAALILSTVAAAPAMAGSAKDINFGGSVTLGTDDIDRGISQTGGDASVKAALDVTGLPYGFFAGVTASNFTAPDTDSEFAAYVGFLRKYGNLSVGADATYYLYPGATDELDYDYVELGANAAYDLGLASVKGEVFWSPDYFGSTGDAWYKRGTLTVPASFLADGLSVYGGAGHQTLAALDYAAWDYRGGVVYDAGFATFGVEYTAHQKVDRDGTVTATVTKSF